MYLMFGILYLISFLSFMWFHSWEVDGIWDLVGILIMSGVIAGVLFPLIGTPIMALIEFLVSL